MAHSECKSDRVTPGPSLVFHVCSRKAAQQAKLDGQLVPASIAAEGFVHLSQRHQIAAVLAAFYADVPDTVILELDPARLTAPLRYEAPSAMAGSYGSGSGSSGATPAPAAGLFPHLYGPINADAIVRVIDAVGA